MKTYLRIVYMDFLLAKEFAAAFLAQIIYLPISLGIVYFVWSKLYETHPGLAGASGMDLKAVICYYMVANIIVFITGKFWYLNYTIWSDINKGNLSIYLARPLDYINFRFFREAGSLTLNTLLGTVSVIVIGRVFNLFELSAFSLFVFLVSVAESILLIFFLQFFVGTLTFWTDKIFGVRDVLLRVVQFLSGLVLPLAFFPPWSRTILEVLPFKYIYNSPAMALTQSNPSIFLRDQALAIIWIAAGYLSVRKFFSYGLKRYVANGG